MRDRRENWSWEEARRNRQGMDSRSGRASGGLTLFDQWLAPPVADGPELWPAPLCPRPELELGDVASPLGVIERNERAKHERNVLQVGRRRGLQRTRCWAEGRRGRGGGRQRQWPGLTCPAPSIPG